jgi:hypothetical protein
LFRLLSSPLALALVALAHAGGAAAEVPAEGEPAVVVAAPVPAARSETVGMAMLGADVEGSIDPPGRVEALVEIVAPTGTPFVPSGEADRVGIPIGTIPRLRHVLIAVGYAAEISEKPSPAGMRLQLKLHALDRVRRIFVTGNQPFFRQGIRQEDIIGKLSIRPGQKLPASGERRRNFLASETDHVRDFLRSSGYWEADAAIELHDDGKVPAQINLLVRVKLGPPYPLGPLTITGATALDQESIADGFHHGDWHWLWALPQPFKRTTLRHDITELVLRYRRVGFPGVRVQDASIARPRTCAWASRSANASTSRSPSKATARGRRTACKTC